MLIELLNEIVRQLCMSQPESDWYWLSSTDEKISIRKSPSSYHPISKLTQLDEVLASSLQSFTSGRLIIDVP